MYFFLKFQGLNLGPHVCCASDLLHDTLAFMCKILNEQIFLFLQSVKLGMGILSHVILQSSECHNFRQSSIFCTQKSLEEKKQNKHRLGIREVSELSLIFFCRNAGNLLSNLLSVKSKCDKYIWENFYLLESTVFIEVLMNPQDHTEFRILLPQAPEYQDYRHVPSKYEIISWKWKPQCGVLDTPLIYLHMVLYTK